MTDWYKIKRVLIWQGWVEKQIYPAGWKPNANTLAYYPLTANLVDKMWNWNTGTMVWTCTFSSTTGIYVTGDSGNYVTWMSNGIWGRNVFTMNVWIKPNKYATFNYVKNIIWGENVKIEWWWPTQKFYPAFKVWNSLLWSQSDAPSYDGNWVNVCIIADWTKYYWYQNGVKISEVTNSWTLNSETLLNLWWNSNVSDRWWTTYVKDYIAESTARTAEKVSAYYEQTKSNYWL